MARNSNIYKDKERGTWYFVANYGKNRFGKRIQCMKRGFRTAKEAKEAYQKQLKEFQESNGVYLKGIKFMEFYTNYFFPWYKTVTLEKTYYKTDRTLQRAIAYFGNLKMENIRPIHIQEFQQYLIHECTNENNKGEETPLAPNYIRQMFNKLRVIFERARVLEVIKDNPVDSIGKMRTTKPKVDFWTYQEFKTVYNFSQKDDFYEEFYKRMMRFLFVTGIRSEELFALLWSDITFQSNTLSVTKSLYIKTRTDYEVSDTKNESSNRRIVLDDRTMADLLEWKQKQKQIGEIDFIFSFDGLPPSAKTFRTRIQSLAKAAGVKPIHLHGLRHSHVAFLIEHNQNIYAVSKRLGHSSIKTTLDKYGHLYPETNQKLAAEFTKFDI